jgi:hypothetical protein
MVSDSDIDQPFESTGLFPNLLDSDGRGRSHRHYLEVPSTSEMPLTTLREFMMLHIMNAVTDKPNWNVKVAFSYCFI